MTIGQLAQQASVGVETIRFYERQGLLPEPPRSAAGYRRYSSEELDRLRFIRGAKQLGFSLSEIGELLELRHEPSTACDSVRERVEGKLADIRSRIRSLEEIQQDLEQLHAACDANAADDCPTLDQINHRRI